MVAMVVHDIGAMRRQFGRAVFSMVAGPEGPGIGRAFTTRRGRGGSTTTGRSGGCTATPRCSSAVCARCCCSPCIRWPWRGWPTTPTTGAIRGGDCTDQHVPGSDHLRHVDRRPTRRRPGARHPHPGARHVGPDGRPYEATDPHLLEWVHIAEIDSFLLAHQLYGAAPLDQQGRDAYVADTARVAMALGVADPPRTEKELTERIAAYRPELTEHRRGPGSSALPAADSPAAPARQGALRGAGRHVRGDAAVVGEGTVAVAVLPSDGDDGGARVRARAGRRDPLGVGVQCLIPAGVGDYLPELDDLSYRLAVGEFVHRGVDLIEPDHRGDQ